MKIGERQTFFIHSLALCVSFIWVCSVCVHMRAILKAHKKDANAWKKQER